MGGIDADKIKAIGETSLDDVKNTMTETKSWLNSNTDAAKYPHVLILFQMMEGAAELAIKEFPKPSTEKGPEYYQAVESLKSFRLQLGAYFKNPVEATMKPVVETSGHFVDRVSQKILATAGTVQLKDAVSKLISEQATLRTLVAQLNASAKALGAFAKGQAVDALHSNFASDHAKASCASKLWLTSAIVSSAGFLCFAHHAMSVVPDFLSKLDIPSEGANTFILLSLSPRLLFAGGIATIAFSCWRNFHTYKHLQISARRKETAAKLIPLVTLNMSEAERSKLQHDFVLRMAAEEETGFIAQAKEAPSVVNLAKMKGD